MKLIGNLLCRRRYKVQTRIKKWFFKQYEKITKEEVSMCMKLNERLKNLTVIDIGLTKMAAMVFGITIAKLFPQLLNLNFVTLIVIMLILGAKPLYTFWLKK